MIDVIGQRFGSCGSKFHNVFDNTKEIVWPHVHNVFWYVEFKFTVDTEASNFSKSVAIFVKELLTEKCFGFVNLRWVAWAKTSIDTKQSGFMLRNITEEVESLCGKGIEDQRISRIWSSNGNEWKT